MRPNRVAIPVIACGLALASIGGGRVAAETEQAKALGQTQRQIAYLIRHHSIYDGTRLDGAIAAKSNRRIAFQGCRATITWRGETRFLRSHPKLSERSRRLQPYLSKYAMVSTFSLQNLKEALVFDFGLSLQVATTTRWQRTTMKDGKALERTSGVQKIKAVAIEFFHVIDRRTGDLRMPHRVGVMMMKARDLCRKKPLR